MPIRFQCQRCRHLLGIASRKAGSQIECPKCGFEQVVPSEEAAAAALAMNQFARTADQAPQIDDLVVYDDQPAAIDFPRQSPAAQATTPGAATPIAREMILVSRRSIYIQGILLLVVALTAFGTGYFVGLGDAEEQQRLEAIQRQRVFVRGTLFYNKGGGESARDEGAVIIALPEGNLPKPKLSYEGLRPKDTLRRGLTIGRQIEQKLGGGYARTDAKGNFDMVLPVQGKYYVLIISKNVRRPEESEIDEAELIRMGNYFISPESLLGRSKFRWTLEKIDADFKRIELDFSRHIEE